MTYSSHHHAVAVQDAEPPSSAASEASGREGRSARLCSLLPCGNLFLPLGPFLDSLPFPHTSGSVDAASKPASVARPYCRRAPHSGTTTANGFNSRSPLGDRARGHRELNRRDNSRHRSGKRGSQHCSDPPPSPWNGKRKPGRARVWGRGAQLRCGKAPPSRSDRPPQGGRERVGRGSLRVRRRHRVG